MQCPRCQSENSKVVDTRKTEDGKAIRRRRECIECGFRYTTFERIQIAPLLVVKKDGSREEFNREKVSRGIIRACEKRPVTYEQMEDLVDDLERSIRMTGKTEVSSNTIGEMVMERLVDVDEVAYIRFASVYRRFDDIDTFIGEVEHLREKRSSE